MLEELLLWKDETFRSAEEQMDLDVRLWRSMGRHEFPKGALLRVYGWDRPAVTVGRGSPLIEGVVRRPTGGGMVKHEAGLSVTYSLMLAGRVWKQWGLRTGSFYEFLHERIACVFREREIEVGLASEGASSPADGCFSEPVVGDVMRSSDGMKLAGAALRRGKNAVLVQGEIKWIGKEKLEAEELGRALAKRIILWDEG